MSLAANALGTVAEFKTWADVSDSSEDARIELLLNATSSLIEGYCATNLRVATVTDELHEGGKKSLFLRRYPVVSITSIVDDAGNTVPATDYFLLGDRGIVRHYGRFPTPASSQGFPTAWKVTYSAGMFATVDLVHASLKLACFMLTQERRENETSGDASISVGSLSISQAPATSNELGFGFPPEVIALLNPYRRNLCP